MSESAACSESSLEPRLINIHIHTYIVNKSIINTKMRGRQRVLNTINKR